MYSTILGSAIFSIVRLAVAQDPIVLSSFWVGQISGEQECGGGVPNDCNEGGTWAMSDLSNFCSTVGVGSPFPAANGAQTNWCNVTVRILPFYPYQFNPSLIRYANSLGIFNRASVLPTCKMETKSLCQTSVLEPSHKCVVRTAVSRETTMVSMHCYSILLQDQITLIRLVPAILTPRQSVTQTVQMLREAWCIIAIFAAMFSRILRRDMWDDGRPELMEGWGLVLLFLVKDRCVRVRVYPTLVVMDFCGFPSFKTRVYY